MEIVRKIKKNPKYLRKIEIIELKDFVNIIEKKIRKN